jgi:hypothetical protein
MKTDVVQKLDVAGMKSDILELLSKWFTVVEGGEAQLAVIGDVRDSLEKYLLDLKDLILSTSEIGYLIFIPKEGTKEIFRGNWPYVEDATGNVFQVVRQMKDGWFVHRGANKQYLGGK